MEGKTFDSISKAAGQSKTRRGALAALAGGVLAAVGIKSADAQNLGSPGTYCPTARYCRFYYGALRVYSCYSKYCQTLSGDCYLKQCGCFGDGGACNTAARTRYCC